MNGGRDLTLPVRIAVITRLKATPRIVELVGAEVKAKPDDNQAWPFIRWGVPPLVTPFLATGINGCTVPIVLHGFAEGATDDNARILASAIVDAMDGAAMALDMDEAPEAKLADTRWTGTTVLEDIGGEADRWHAVVNFEATVIG